MVCRTLAAVMMVVVVLSPGWAEKGKVKKNVPVEGAACITCHSDHSPGLVADFKNSAHAGEDITCLACHEQEKGAAGAVQCSGISGSATYISAWVSPAKCADCHEDAVREFEASGHVRAAKQIIPKQELQKLMFFHEGQSHPEFQGAPNENGCMQCHGETVKLDKEGRPLPETWPTSGIGNVYPDGSIGNCTVCHTRHRFSLEEARKPEACASCHLGPDHPQFEIYESSKHGQVYATEGEKWDFSAEGNTWKPGDYRAPTCAVCHMSGNGGELEPTHNVSDRLYWNLWGKISKPRGSDDPFSALTGDAEKGREKMEKVCSSCHGTTFIKSTFAQGDKQVKLYNDAYYKPALAMLEDLKSKKLLLPPEEQWADEFFNTFYHLWHHEGRIMRMGAMMCSADWAHWHGSFKVMNDLAKLKKIYAKRIETGKIE